MKQPLTIKTIYWLPTRHTLITTTSLPSKPTFSPSATVETPRATLCESTPSTQS